MHDNEDKPRENRTESKKFNHNVHKLLYSVTSSYRSKKRCLIY